MVNHVTSIDVIVKEDDLKSHPLFCCNNDIICSWGCTR